MDLISDFEEMDDRQRKLFETSVFLAKLLFAGIIFRTILFLEPGTYTLQTWLSDITSSLLNAIGVSSSVDGVFVMLETGVYEITRDCLGWKSMAAFLGLMFASSSLRENRRFIFTGLLVIIASNIVRVTTTIYLTHIGFISFDIIHGTLWRWGLTAVVMLLWLQWLQDKDVQTFYTSFLKKSI